MLIVLVVLGLTAVLAIGITQAGSDEEVPASRPFDLDAALASLEGAPAPLASLHEQSSALLGGGDDAFEQRLRTLEGSPVVVNKWASWCGPCRFEFPFFQELATERGKQVAFLGLNSGDKTAAAERFLRRYPVPFPSYEDPDEKIARKLRAPTNYPVTIFIDDEGEIALVHQGAYRDKGALAADIDRYLGS
ncbi:MAG: TlpA family protein disulfide reductase [Gaiellaceae bacterium]